MLGLELGADDYIMKPFSIREFRSRVRALLRRARLSPAELEEGTIDLDGVRIDLWLAGSSRSASATRRADLPRVRASQDARDAPGRVFSRRTLLEKLWGGSDYRDPRTIDVHVRHLREKLEADPSDPQRILTVRGVGYRFSESAMRSLLPLRSLTISSASFSSGSSSR